MPLITFEKAQTSWRPTCVVHQARGRTVRGHGAGEGHGLPDEKAPQPPDGAALPLAGAHHGVVNHYYFSMPWKRTSVPSPRVLFYNAKLCLNGHEYLKRQLTRHGIAYEAWTPASSPYRLV